MYTAYLYLYSNFLESRSSSAGRAKQDWRIHRSAPSVRRQAAASGGRAKEPPKSAVAVSLWGLPVLQRRERHMYIYICIYTCTHMYMGMCMYVYVYVYIYIYVCIHVYRGLSNCQYHPEVYLT